MTARVFPVRTGAYVDAWVRQVQSVEDLLAFVRAHGPSAGRPLPVLNWTIGAFHAINAELPASDPYALETLSAYARVLGARVATRTEADRVCYALRGRLGQREGDARQPRINVVIRASVRRRLEDGTAPVGGSL
jgi:hypothetical protein